MSEVNGPEEDAGSNPADLKRALKLIEEALGILESNKAPGDLRARLSDVVDRLSEYIE